MTVEFSSSLTPVLTSVGILIIVLPVLLLALLWLLTVLSIGVIALNSLNGMLKSVKVSRTFYLSNMVVSSVMVSDKTDVYSDSFISCFDSKFDKTEEPTGL